MPALPWYALAALAVLAAVLGVLERIFPLRRRTAAGLRRLGINLTSSALAFGASVLAVEPAAAAALGWSSQARLGVLHLAELPPAIAAAVTFLLMDLFFYYWHQLNHRVPLLWRFHNVHHTDPDLDVTTAFRFHFGEVALSAGFRVVQIVLIGPSLWLYVVYEFALQASTLFHHSNLRLPIRLERALCYVLVTPRMHGIHHSQVFKESRSNYGVVFPWWDRLHRTLELDVPQSCVAIGMAGYALPEDNRVRRILTLPFQKQRAYWIRADGSAARREPANRDVHSRL